MAKKKAPSTIESSKATERETSQIDLAAPISAHAKIHNVVLASCEAKRSAEATFSPNQHSIDCVIEHIEIGIDKENSRFFIKPGFTLKVMRKDLPEAEACLLIKASFAIAYSVEAIEKYEEKVIHAFAGTNGIFNAWPYWREFAQNTALRMGIPGIIIPLFRVSTSQTE